MIVENFKMAMDSIVANKMRSFLTMLGIIIGTASVISILSVGNGATEEMTQTFADIGATTISLTADPDQEERDLITLEDLDFLKENIDEIDHLSPPQPNQWSYFIQPVRQPIRFFDLWDTRPPVLKCPNGRHYRAWPLLQPE